LNNEEGNKKVHIICTGGTIDKEYDRIAGSLIIGKPALVRAFGAAGVRSKTLPLEALKKDSLEITDDERLLIANLVAASATEAVLVTHGTDTMSETAALIESLGCGKTVVITGAMVPRDFPGSDADFNLGFRDQAGNQPRCLAKKARLRSRASAAEGGCEAPRWSQLKPWWAS